MFLLVAIDCLIVVTGVTMFYKCLLFSQVFTSSTSSASRASSTSSTSSASSTGSTSSTSGTSGSSQPTRGTGTSTSFGAVASLEMSWCHRCGVNRHWTDTSRRCHRDAGFPARPMPLGSWYRRGSARLQCSCIFKGKRLLRLQTLCRCTGIVCARCTGMAFGAEASQMY